MENFLLSAQLFISDVVKLKVIVKFGETAIQFLLFVSYWKNTRTVTVSSYSDKVYVVKFISTRKNQGRGAFYDCFQYIAEHIPGKRK